MPYQLDTTGAVAATDGLSAFASHYDWTSLDAFTQGYVAELFADHGEDLHLQGCANGALLADSSEAPAFSDLAPETLARIIADCEAMLPRYPASAFAHRHPDTGRAFWAARQAGNINGFPPLTVRLDDDGKVRFAN